MPRGVSTSTVLSVLASAIFISGCASPIYSEHKPSEFREAPDPKSYEIKKVLTSQRKAELLGEVDSTQGILPGTYLAKLEDSEGTLYFGSGRSYFVKYANRDAYYLRPGGFWVPKSNGATPKLFYVVDSSSIITANTLDDAMKNRTGTEDNGYGHGLIVDMFLRSADGHIVIAPTETGFAEALLTEIHEAGAVQTAAGH